MEKTLRWVSKCAVLGFKSDAKIVLNKSMEVTALVGLTDAQVLNRLKEEGYNDLPSAKPRNIFAIAFSVFREPMFMLLVACGVIYLLLGDRQDALMLLGFVFVVMGITFFQERKTERALDALRNLSSPRACVIRNGIQQRIPGREVVRGDTLPKVQAAGIRPRPFSLPFLGMMGDIVCSVQRSARVPTPFDGGAPQ